MGRTRTVREGFAGSFCPAVCLSICLSVSYKKKFLKEDKESSVLVVYTLSQPENIHFYKSRNPPLKTGIKKEAVWGAAMREAIVIFLLQLEKYLYMLTTDPHSKMH